MTASIKAKKIKQMNIKDIEYSKNQINIIKGIPKRIKIFLNGQTDFVDMIIKLFCFLETIFSEHDL